MVVGFNLNNYIDHPEVKLLLVYICTLCAMTSRSAYGDVKASYKKIAAITTTTSEEPTDHRPKCAHF